MTASDNTSRAIKLDHLVNWLMSASSNAGPPLIRYEAYLLAIKLMPYYGFGGYWELLHDGNQFYVRITGRINHVPPRNVPPL